MKRLGVALALAPGLLAANAAHAHIPYDPNVNGVLEKEEVVAVIDDYFNGEVERDEVVEVNQSVLHRAPG